VDRLLQNAIETIGVALKEPFVKIFAGLTILLTIVLSSSIFAEPAAESISQEFHAELTQLSEMIYQIRSGPTWLAEHGSGDTNDAIIHLQANLRILQSMFPATEDAIGQLVVREMLTETYDYNKGHDQRKYLNRLYELIDSFLRPTETAVPKWRETPFGKTFLKQIASLFEMNMNTIHDDSNRNSTMRLFHVWGAETKALGRFAPKDILNGKLPEFLVQTGDYAFNNAYRFFGSDEALSKAIKTTLDAFRRVEKALDDGGDCSEILMQVPGSQLAIEQSQTGGKKRRTKN
jgi:hypothetical protein